jgi:hypothetical protein
MNGGLERGMSPMGKDRLIAKIVSGEEYTFDPIDLHKTADRNWCYYYTIIEEERGIISTEKYKKTEFDYDKVDLVKVYSLGSYEDIYLMLALSKVLLNRVHIGDKGPPVLLYTKIRDFMEEHYSYIGELDRVRTLIKIELDYSFILNTRKTEILSHIDSILDDGLIKDLIKQVVSLPIKGNYGKIIEHSGVARVGELTRVILDLYYRNVFDNHVLATCPELRFSRWFNEVFIAIDMKGFLIRKTTIYRLFSTGKSQKPPLTTSCNDCNKLMLISAIESIYNNEWRERGVLPFKMERLQTELLLKNNFLLGPIDYYQYRKSEIPNFLYEILCTQASLGYLWMNEWVEDGDDMIGVYKCREPTDFFLMTALSRVLLRRISSEYIAPITTNVSTMNDVKCMHYALLKRLQNVVKLILIDLSPCMEQATNSRILNRFRNETSKGVVFHLVKQILYLSIYDMNTKKKRPFNLIPPIGEITNVISHLFYQTVFDTVLEEKYPGITYSRWGHEVIIAIKKNDSFTIDDNTVISLLDEIDLDGEFEFLSLDELGCLPVCNGEKAILLDEDGSVSVWRYEDL